MSKKSRYRGIFDRQHGKRAQALLKSSSQHLDHIHQSLPRKLIWKKSLWSTCQIVGLLVNLSAADEKYPVSNRDNLTTAIQIELSQKEQNFSDFVGTFSKSRLNFEDFEKKDDNHSFFVSEITDCENVVR